MICTFFGHRNCPSTISKQLEEILEILITENNIIKFYVGNNGNFDSIVYNILKKLKTKHPHVSYSVVISYIPCKKASAPLICESDTLVPDGIETIPKRFSISYRNEWMINKSDMVIGYVNKSCGGAFKYFELAKKKGKTCINLCEIQE